jgi:hypothetical protein
MKVPVLTRSVGDPGLRVASPLVLLAGCLVLAGCGPSGPPTYPIAGVVTYDGKPLPTGTLTLIPDSPKARTTVAPITDGVYSTAITAGEWTVNIMAVRNTGPVDPKLKEAPREQYLPAKYNRQSTMKVTSPVEGGKKDFDLAP